MGQKPAPISRIRLIRHAWFSVAAIALATTLVSDHVNANNRIADRRQQMRDFIVSIAQEARAERPGFVIVTQNGLDLMTQDGSPGGPFATEYISVLDGVSQEGLSFGFAEYCAHTTKTRHSEMLTYLKRARNAGLAVLLTDYCDKEKSAAHANEIATAQSFISFVSPDPDFSLSSIPRAPERPPGHDINRLLDARNYLYLLNPEKFAQVGDLVRAISASNFDIAIVDPLFRSDRPLAETELIQMQRKPNGRKRLILAYLNIGAAENWRDYWQPGWRAGSPTWLEKTYSEEYPDEHWVRYWHKEWQEIIYSSPNSYLRRVLRQGFDGIFLDNIDAYEIFEG